MNSSIKWLKYGEHGEPVQVKAVNSNVRAASIAKEFGIDVDCIKMSGVLQYTDNEGNIKLAENEGLSASEAILVTGVSTWHRAPVYPSREVIHKSVELVDKLLVAGKRAGTAVAFASNDKVYALTAAHAILDEGIVVSDIKAFGIQLKCKGYRVEPDIAILEPANKAEHLDAGFQPVDNAEVYVGVTATMLSYPEGLDIPPPAGCQTTTGTITGYDDVMTYAFASYPGAMPNSSGGAVMTFSGRLLGIHCGLCFYEEPRRSPTSSIDETTQDLALMKVDTAYAVDNIPHKGGLPYLLLIPKVVAVLKEVDPQPVPKSRRTRIMRKAS